MSQKPELKLNWCSYKAAKYAVEHWHYSRTLISTYGRPVYIGVWESGEFIGVVVFSRSANNNLGKPYGLNQFQCSELVRVALRRHSHPVTKIVSIAIRMVKRQSPGIRLIVSFADPAYGHQGSIYQGGNWIYTGMSKPVAEYVINGERIHGRAVSTKYGTKKKFRDNVVMGSSKHRYLMPLDPEIRTKLLALAKPYPKRAASIAPDAPSDQDGEDGRQPIAALQ